MLMIAAALTALLLRELCGWKIAMLLLFFGLGYWARQSDENIEKKILYLADFKIKPSKQ